MACRASSLPNAAAESAPTASAAARTHRHRHPRHRHRRLLLHRVELDKLFTRTQVKGLALVALRLYWKGSRVKVELGVGKGKEQRDLRADLKDRAVKRETEREVASFNRRRG